MLRRRVQTPDPHDDVTESLPKTLTQYQEDIEILSNKLASREEENLVLVQALSEMKEKHTQSAHLISELETRVSDQKEKQRMMAHDQETEQVIKLNGYNYQVNEKLQNLESDNKALADEKLGLDRETVEMKQADERRAQERSRIPTACEKAVQTSSGIIDELPTQTDQELHTKEDLAMQIRLLELQLAQAQSKHDVPLKETQISQDPQSQDHHNRDSQTTAASAEVLQRESTKLDQLRVQLQREFDEFKTASDEAALESERRLAFLATCVAECSRLVDGPRAVSVTSHDLYDTVLALSRKVGTGHPMAHRSRDSKAASTVALWSRSALQGLRKPRSARLSQEDVESSQPHTEQALVWNLRCAKLQQQLRTALLKNDHFEDMTRRLDLHVSELKRTLKDHVSRELVLATKNGSLKEDITSLKTSLSTLSARHSQVREELQQRTREYEVIFDEANRMRSALQRKSDLLHQSKTKVAQLSDELQEAMTRVESLLKMEKKAALCQQKAKEQLRVVQGARRQLESSQAQEYQLVKEAETRSQENASLHVRVKSLRAENASLRAQTRDLKQKIIEHQSLSNAAGPNATARTDRYAASNANETQIAAATQGLPSDNEVKALRKRVLQKQQLILCHRTKIAEQETEISQLRSKLLAASQTVRDMQLELAAQKDRALRHVAAMRDDIQSALSQKAHQLDGLRASIYDSLEAFIHCRGEGGGSGGVEVQCRNRMNICAATAPTRSPTHKHSHLGGRSSTSGQDSTSEHKDAFDMRRWVDLPAEDLEELQSISQTEKQRRAREIASADHGKELLAQVERAFEQYPEDCRTELCHVLEFLWERERERWELRISAARSC